jgi:NAD(P)-dependent dehydrogenase (short-subunit alcohol dehydrogenase family)
MLRSLVLVALLAGASAPMPHIPPCTPTTTGRQVAELENAQTRRPLGHNAMAGKLVVVTGGDSGIGLSTASAIARANATVVIASYDPDGAGAAAKTKISRATQNSKITVLGLDLSSLSSVRSFATALVQQLGGLSIDVLINCAGIADLPAGLSAVTADGFDRVFQTNYLGHFLLTELLLPSMRLNPTGARVINVASEASEFACLWADANANCLVPEHLQLAVRTNIGRTGQNNSFAVASSACELRPSQPVLRAVRAHPPHPSRRC